MLAIGRLLDQFPNDGLESREQQRTLQLHHPDPVAVAAERMEGGSRQATAGVHLGGIVAAAQGRLRDRARIEHVERQFPGKVHADADAPDAIPLLVKRRRENPDPELTRQHREDPPTHTALRRQSDAVDPFAGPVIHPGAGHHGEDVVDILVGNGALTGDRIHPLVRQGRAHHGEVRASDAQRALLEIGLQDIVRILVDDSEIPQHPADRPVAVPGLAFRAVNLLVDVELAAGAGRQIAGDPLDPRLSVFGEDLPAGRDCSRVDHRVERRATAGLEADGVKGIARRLHADPRKHVILPPVFQRQAVGKSLGNRLDGEFLPGVPDLVKMTVASRDADAEVVRIRVRKLRDVVGHLAFAQGGISLVKDSENLGNRGFHGLGRVPIAALIPNRPGL